MARPNKTGLDYFPFDVGFFEDEKIIAISGEYGIKGELTVIKLLCAIYRNGYFILWNDLFKYKLLKSLPGVSSDLLENIVKRLALWGFFDMALFRSTSVLTSTAIQKRYFEAVKRRKPTSDMPYILVNVDRNHINANNNQVNASINTTKESKGKENSLSREKEIYGDFVEVSLDECKEQLESDRSWIEIVTMNTRSNGHGDFTLQSTLDYIRMFFTKLQNEGLKAKNVADAKAHFARWLQIQLKHEENSRTDKQQANDYAFKQYLAERGKVEKGVYDQVSDIFAD